jgi:hypothetical protein
LAAIDAYFEKSGDLLEETKKNIRRLKAEIDDTSTSFNFKGVLDAALAPAANEARGAAPSFPAARRGGAAAARPGPLAGVNG